MSGSEALIATSKVLEVKSIMPGGWLRHKSSLSDSRHNILGKRAKKFTNSTLRVA